jgi:4-amino-4-deoxy-L-arabinose transferase-like glycosyltransferase
MNLVLGYNGVARVLGRTHLDFDPQGAAGAGSAAADVGGRWHEAQGLPRLLTGEFGFQIGWLLPAALLAVVVVLISRGRAPRTDVVRAGVVVFGGWLVVGGLVLSFMQGMHGMIPPYYCLSLAPAVAAMFAIGIAEMWRQRGSRLPRVGLVAMVFVTGVWSWWVLGRNADWRPPLRWTILAATVVAGAALLGSLTSDAHRRLAVVTLTAGLIGALAGSVGYSIATLGQPHSTGGASVGPASRDHGNGPGWWQDVDNPQLDAMLRATDTTWSAAIKRSSPAASLELSTNTPVMAVGGFLGIDPVPTLDQFQDYVASHQVTYYIVPDPNTDRFPVGRDAHNDIANWVAANFRSMKVGSDTVYDLTAPIAG